MQGSVKRPSSFDQLRLSKDDGKAYTFKISWVVSVFWRVTESFCLEGWVRSQTKIELLLMEILTKSGNLGKPTRLNLSII